MVYLSELCCVRFLVVLFFFFFASPSCRYCAFKLIPVKKECASSDNIYW